MLILFRISSPNTSVDLSEDAVSPVRNVTPLNSKLAFDPPLPSRASRTLTSRVEQTMFDDLSKRVLILEREKTELQLLLKEHEREIEKHDQIFHKLRLYLEFRLGEDIPHTMLFEDEAESKQNDAPKPTHEESNKQIFNPHLLPRNRTTLKKQEAKEREPKPVGDKPESDRKKLERNGPQPLIDESNQLEPESEQPMVEEPKSGGQKFEPESKRKELEGSEPQSEKSESVKPSQQKEPNRKRKTVVIDDSEPEDSPKKNESAKNPKKQKGVVIEELIDEDEIKNQGKSKPEDDSNVAKGQKKDKIPIRYRNKKTQAPKKTQAGGRKEK